MPEDKGTTVLEENHQVTKKSRVISMRVLYGIPGTSYGNRYNIRREKE